MASLTLTQAEKFRIDYTPYFFEDAHHLVEAYAASTAKEVSHNVFEFSDGSVLRVGQNVMVVQTYKSLAELEQFIAMRNEVPEGVILPQDC